MAMATQGESSVGARGLRSAAVAFSLFLVESSGCGYDYSQLGARGTGGALAVGSGGFTEAGGQGGGAPGTGGSAPGDGGRRGPGGTAAPATGGSSESGGQTAVATGGSTGDGTGGLASSGGRPGSGGGAAGGPGTGGAAPEATGGAPGTGGRDAGPVILSVDFVGGTPASSGAGALVAPSAQLTPAETAGAQPAANWNSAFGNLGALTQLALADGTTSSASIAWIAPGTSNTSGVWRNNYTATDANSKMMQGYLDPVATDLPGLVTLASLPASLTRRGYDLYLYFTADLTRVETFTFQYAVGSATRVVTQVGPTATTFQGFRLASDDGTGNTLVFHGLTGSGFTLVATPGSGSHTRAPINGIQLVSPPGN